MSKAVLISIRPEWCDLIVRGEKTIEGSVELRQMLMQKTAGQRKDRPKDLSWENLERVKVTIICESMALVLSGDYEKMEAQHDS